MAKQRIIYSIILIISFALFLTWEDYFVHLLFYFLLLLPVVSLVISLPLCFLLRCRLEFPHATAAKNTPVSFRIRLRNLYPIPAPCVKATVECINALSGSRDAAKEKIRFSAGFSSETQTPVALSFPFCGKITVRIRYLRVCDLLGLFSIPVLHRNKLLACVHVLPDLMDIECETESGVDLGQESTVYSDKKPGNDPAEIFRLRDYRAGDRPHSIHWKLSSRLDRLVVREFGLPLNISVRFLFEHGKYMSLQQTDLLLEAFYSLASFLAEQGMIQNVHWMSSPQILETRMIAEEDALAAALYELLSIPALSERGSALSEFAQEEIPLGCHLIYLAAPDESCDPVPLLLNLLHDGICRRISVLTASSKEKFRELEDVPGCEVYSLCGGVFSAGFEEMKV